MKNRKSLKSELPTLDRFALRFDCTACGQFHDSLFAGHSLSDRVAIEVFPSQDQLVDEANVYHLWVLPKEVQLPFGLHFSGWSK